MGDFKFKCVYIREEYFKNNNHLIEVLDDGNLEKQTRRKYVFFSFTYMHNTILVPLRSEMPDLKKIGQVGYMVPSDKRPNAGLDFRKILIVNDEKYLEYPDHNKISSAQERILNDSYKTITKLIIAYIDAYIKSAKKNRHLRDKKFCYSTLHNFHSELGIKQTTNK